jgi:hypothetical protein
VPTTDSKLRDPKERLCPAFFKQIVRANSHNLTGGKTSFCSPATVRPLSSMRSNAPAKLV